MTLIFRWSGAYVGFFRDGWFFDPRSRYLGWYEDDGTVWNARGRFLGTVVDDHYVLRALRRAEPVPRPPRVPPVAVDPPTPPLPRLPRAPMPGWTDPLEAIGRMPSTAELIGTWSDGTSTLRLLQDGEFTLSSPSHASAGCFALAPPLLTLKEEGQSRDIRYYIVEAAADALTLRLFTNSERSLLFTLRRVRE